MVLSSMVGLSEKGKYFGKDWVEIRYVRFTSAAVYFYTERT
jgi:hypothetical protein